MLTDILYIIALTFLPFLELRASIPYGILATDIHWILVFCLAVCINFALGVILYPFMDLIISILTKVKIFNNLWELYRKRIQKKIHKSVEKYGEYGVALFIGVPLPGSGTYSGAVASYLLGLSYRKFLMANLIGVLIAGIIVTVVVMSGLSVFDIFIKFP